MSSGTHWQQTLLKQRVPCFPAALPKLHGLNHQKLDNLLSILSSSSSSAHPSTPPSILQPRSAYSLCQYYHQRDGLLCLGLVWTCNRSITLHHTDLRRQQPLEWQIQRDRGGERERQAEKESSARGERRDHPSQKQRDPPVPQRKGPPPPDPSGRRGGPCVAGKATGTMQLGLVALAMVFLSSMGHSDSLKLSKARRQRRGEFSLFLSLFWSLQHCCLSFLWSESQLWTSYKHLTSKVKITFCLFSHHSYLFFLCGLC